MALLNRKKDGNTDDAKDNGSKADKGSKPVKSKPVVEESSEQISGESPKEATKKPTGAYFVSPHPDGGWQVKKANASKALKRFKTKAEAEAYAKQVATNQGSFVIRQKKDGKIQKKR